MATEQINKAFHQLNNTFKHDHLYHCKSNDNVCNTIEQFTQFIGILNAIKLSLYFSLSVPLLLVHLFATFLILLNKTIMPKELHIYKKNATLFSLQLFSFCFALWLQFYVANKFLAALSQCWMGFTWTEFSLLGISFVYLYCFSSDSFFSPNFRYTRNATLKCAS